MRCSLETSRWRTFLVSINRNLPMSWYEIIPIWASLVGSAAWKLRRKWTWITVAFARFVLLHMYLQMKLLAVSSHSLLLVIVILLTLLQFWCGFDQDISCCVCMPIHQLVYISSRLFNFLFIFISISIFLWPYSLLVQMNAIIIEFHVYEFANQATYTQKIRGQINQSIQRQLIQNRSWKICMGLYLPLSLPLLYSRAHCRSAYRLLVSISPAHLHPSLLQSNTNDLPIAGNILKRLKFTTGF